MTLINKDMSPTISGAASCKHHHFALRRFAPAHCTGWRAVHALIGAFGEEIVDPLAVGSRQTL